MLVHSIDFKIVKYIWKINLKLSPTPFKKEKGEGNKDHIFSVPYRMVE